MLNWEQISERIQNPHLCNVEEIPELKDLCEKYPYSQVFPILYLKVLSDVKFIHFEEELEKYAFRITDRVQLYNLLNSNYHNQEAEIGKEISISVDLLEQVGGNDNYQEEILNSPEDIIEKDEEIVPSNANSIETEDLIKIIDEDLGSIVQENNELDQQILASSLGNSYQIEEILEVPTEEGLPVFDLTSDREYVGDELNEIEVIEPQESKHFNLTQNRSFVEWLKMSNESLTDTAKEETDTNSEYEVTYIEFEKPKKEFFSPVKKAKESLSEETLPVSETLAKIFEVQGNIPKAIFVYEQLSLIIPEKKTYFASQIKKIKKKLN